MAKVVCPNCGEIGMYGQRELVERTLIFSAEGCVGSTEDVTLRVGVPRCLECGRKIKFEFEERENQNGRNKTDIQ